MLIEIESVYKDRLIHGKYLDQNILEKALKEILETVGEKQFPSAFCARFGYEELPYSDDVRADDRIDTDTHMRIRL